MIFSEPNGMEHTLIIHRNNMSETMPNVNGVDDYLHQAADKANWPEGITYDPDNSGKPIPSLGIHEHWNNPVNKQYSRNLGKSYGIELISIPAKIVGPGAAKYSVKKTESNKEYCSSGSSGSYSYDNSSCTT